MSQPPTKQLRQPPSFNWFHCGPEDVALLMTIEGKRYEIRSVDYWDELFMRCTNIAEETGKAVKLLPVTGSELCGYLGVEPGSVVTDQATRAADFALIVHTCWDVLRHAPDEVTRVKAFNLLQSLGQNCPPSPNWMI